MEVLTWNKVAIDSKVTSTEELTLESEEKRLVLIGASSCC